MATKHSVELLAEGFSATEQGKYSSKDVENGRVFRFDRPQPASLQEFLNVVTENPDAVYDVFCSQGWNLEYRNRVVAGQHEALAKATRKQHLEAVTRGKHLYATKWAAAKGEVREADQAAGPSLAQGRPGPFPRRPPHRRRG